jgi:hypothetical protein
VQEGDPTTWDIFVKAARKAFEDPLYVPRLRHQLMTLRMVGLSAQGFFLYIEQFQQLATQADGRPGFAPEEMTEHMLRGFPSALQAYLGLHHADARDAEALMPFAELWVRHNGGATTHKQETPIPPPVALDPRIHYQQTVEPSATPMELDALNTKLRELSVTVAALDKGKKYSHRRVRRHSHRWEGRG